MGRALQADGNASAETPAVPLSSGAEDARLGESSYVNLAAKPLL